MSDQIITNQAIVDELEVYVFDNAKAAPKAVEAITGNSRGVQEIDGKLYVKHWLEKTPAEQAVLALADRKIKIKDLRAILDAKECIE